MKKNYIYLFTILALAGSLAWFFNNAGEQEAYTKCSNASELMVQQQLHDKIERRKRGYAKPDKPDKYLEYIHLLKTGGDPKDNYSINNALNELKKAKLKSARLKSGKSLAWKQRGPGNVGGRTRGFVVDPDDSNYNTWYAGPVGGGVWKTSDGGRSWICLTLDWPNLSVSSLVMAPSNHDVMYAGTGEGFGNMDAIKGNGIFKTTNRGATWLQLTTIADDSRFEYVNRLIIDPADENIVVAATNTGIYKTVDGGTTWEECYAGEGRIQDLRALPGNFNTQFATQYNTGIMASIDAGQTWHHMHTINEGRIELCMSPAFPEQMYAMTEESEIYLSSDGGDNWVKTVPNSKVDFTASQGWYNNTLVADPTDSKRLFVGGIDLHKVVIGSEIQAGGVDALDIQLTNTDFLAWKDMGGKYLAGGIRLNADQASNYKDVLIQFGPGMQQNAHCFTTASSDVNPMAAEFTYQNYVAIPFTVTDIASGNQLMVSFRDDNEDGLFNLTANSKEQLYIHAEDYATEPSADITAEGGIAHQKILDLYPVLAEGAVWQPDALPEASITLDHYSLKGRTITSMEQSVWWNKQAANYSHADHHNLQVITEKGSPYRIVNCNDGGVFISEDGGATWDERTAGYVTTQFYGIAKHPTQDIYVGGTQDNGTWVSPVNPDENSSWASPLGGDGFEVAWNNYHADKIAISLYNNQIRITHDGGQSWFAAEIDDVDEKGPFVTRIANEVSDPNRLYVGGASGVWYSQDFGRHWKLTTMPDGTWKYGSTNPHVAVSPVNSRFVWAGNAVSAVDGIALSQDAGRTFSPVSGRPAGVGSYISELVAHPTNEQGVYAIFSRKGQPKIVYSPDLGVTWSDLTQFEDGKSMNGFPDVAVYSLVVMPNDTNILWAGTEIGIFESTDGGQTWLYANNGLPAVCIWDMKIVGQQLVVGTHGLGVWTLDLPEVAVDKAPFINAVAKGPDGRFHTELDFFSSYDRVELFCDDELIETFSNVTSGPIAFNFAKTSAKTSFNMYMVAYNGSITRSSNYVWVDNPNIEVPLQKYMNSFSVNKYDFSGKGFRVSQQLFNDWAIHSDHPYPEDKMLTYQLKYPIEVMDNPDVAVMTYRDIVLVEPGETGAQYGDAEYWDYVVVEGSKDGINWIALEDIDGDGEGEGYDVNYSSKWVSFAGANYRNLQNTPDESSLYQEHTIKLHDTFAPGELIFIRFRLHSDLNTVGWGWVIDDVIIQEAGTSVELDEQTADVLRVSPNPATSFIDLAFQSPLMGEVNVVVYDVDGRAVLARDFNKTSGLWERQLPVAQLNRGLKIFRLSINGNVYQQKVLLK